MKLSDLIIGYNGHAITCALSAELNAGDFVCLIGRNGCGKSTLLRTLAGLLPPVGGAVVPDSATSSASIVLTSVPDLRNTHIRDLVAYGRLSQCGMLGRLKDADRAAADTAMRLVGISALAGRYFHHLSDGEKQKAMIAMALVQERAILLLDEPSAFLDYPSRCDLMNLLRRLAHESRKAVLLSTHDVELACQHADRLWLLQDGALRIFRPSTDSTWIAHLLGSEL